MSDQRTFIAHWATDDDVQPLVLTGGIISLQETIGYARSLFPKTDVYEMIAVEKTIRIEDIRTMRQTTAQSAWEGRRLVIISEAEKLSGTAAQALLKILEEPSRSTRIILTTKWYRRLLPTIRSRCIHIRLTATPIQPSAAAVAPMPTSVLSRLVTFSGDSPLTAETLERFSRTLELLLRQEGPTPKVRAAYLRLKDYYLISSFPGGNVKLARDVLLASLPD